MTLCLGNSQMERIGPNRVVLSFLWVEVAELDGRNAELAPVTWHNDIVVGDIALGTCCRVGRLVVLLGIIDLEVLRETNGGSLHELHVALTADDEPKGGCIVGIDLFRSQRGRHRELADGTREVVRTRGRKGQDLNLDGRCLYLFAHHLREASAAEEDVEGVHAVVLHLNLSVESDAGNFYLARLLREHDVLLPDGCAVVTPVDALVLEG